MTTYPDTRIEQAAPPYVAINITDDEGFIVETFDTLAEALAHPAPPLARIHDEDDEPIFIRIGDGWLPYRGAYLETDV